MGGEGYYSEEVVRRIFKVSRQKLYYWRKIGLLPCREKGSPQGYSFSDVFSIKVICKLVGAGIRVSKIKKAVDSIQKNQPEIQNPLLEKTLFLTGKEICYFLGGLAYEAVTGQMFLFSNEELKKELKAELKVHSRYSKPNKTPQKSRRVS